MFDMKFPNTIWKEILELLKLPRSTILYKILINDIRM